MTKSTVFIVIVACLGAVAYPLSMEAQNTTFTGEVTDKNYVSKNNITDILLTDSSAVGASKTHFSFDTYGRIKEKKVQKVDKTISSFYVYDAKGNLIKLRTMQGADLPISEEKFEYDAQNRLSLHETTDFAQKKSTIEQIEWIDDVTRFTLRKTNDQEERFLTVFTPDMRPLDVSYADGSGFMWLYADGLAVVKKEKGLLPTLNIERYEYDDNRRITLAEDIFSQKQYLYDLKNCLARVETRDSEGNLMSSQNFEYNFKVQ